jgi:hypothetical protein
LRTKSKRREKSSSGESAANVRWLTVWFRLRRRGRVVCADVPIIEPEELIEDIGFVLHCQGYRRDAWQQSGPR